MFKLFGASKCSVCRRSFAPVEEVDREDETLVTRAVLDGKFECVKCKVAFHGKCGKVGQVSPSKATVKCPKCRLMQKLPLPFKYSAKGNDGKKKQDYFDEIKKYEEDRNG